MDQLGQYLVKGRFLRALSPREWKNSLSLGRTCISMGPIEQDTTTCKKKPIMKSAPLIFSAAVLAIAMAAASVAGAQTATGAPPTFNKDVAAILFNNCVTCHRPNQIAPMFDRFSG